MGYYADRRMELIRRYAYRCFEIRMKYDWPGGERDDWEKAEMMVDIGHPHLTHLVHKEAEEELRG